MEGPLSLSSSGAGGEATRPGRAAERQSAAVEHRGTRKSPLRGSLLQANFQVKARTPTATPSRSIGTPSTVRKPPDRCPSFHVKSGSARTSGMWMTLASSDGALIGAAQLYRRLKERIERCSQIEGRAADCFKHFRGGSLLLAGLA